MNATRQAKNLLKDAFPGLWLHWHLMHRPKSAERELSYLGKVVPPDAVTVDVGANCGLYTRQLARLSREVHAFEPSPQMARLLRRTSASNVSVHEIALSDHAGEADLFIPEGENGLVHGLASLEPANQFEGGASGLESRADRAPRCRHPAGRGLREDRRGRTRAQRAPWRDRPRRAQPAGISGRGRRPPPYRSDAIGVRVLPQAILPGLLPPGR